MSEESTAAITSAKLIASLTIVGFTYGIIYQTVYYSFFSFNVFEYTELNEIITHTIKNCIYLIVPFTIGWLIGVNRPERNVQPLPIKKKKSFLRENLFLFINIAMWIGIGICWYLNIFKAPIALFMILSFFSPLVYELSGFLKLKLLEKYEIKIDVYGYTLLTAIIIITYGATMFGLLEANTVLNDHSSRNTYIIVKGDTVKSTSKYYYIGRTNNYIFFYNSQNESTDVYPEKEINELSLHHYEKYDHK